MLTTSGGGPRCREPSSSALVTGAFCWTYRSQSPWTNRRFPCPTSIVREDLSTTCTPIGAGRKRSRRCQTLRLWPYICESKTSPKTNRRKRPETMDQSPSESEPEVYHESRPLPCTECGSNKGFVRVGKFRSQCTNCNALLTNAEIGVPNQDPQ